MAKRPKHDEAYKHLFTHRRIVEDLLCGYAGDWTRMLDFSTMEQLSGEFVPPGLIRRSADMLWRVRFRDPLIPSLFLQIEFQAMPDITMGKRADEYANLTVLAADEKDRGPNGEPPFVFSLVVYNGRPAWKAPTGVADLIGPGSAHALRELLGFRGHRWYLLLGVRIGRGPGIVPGNLVSAAFALERAGSPTEAARTVGELEELLDNAGDEDLRARFAEWIAYVMRLRGFPGLETQRSKREVMTLGEIRTAFADQVKEWTDRWHREGFEEGIERGREEGREEYRALVRQLAERRFGPETAAALDPLLDRLSHPDRVVDVAGAVVECRTGHEFIARVRTL